MPASARQSADDDYRSSRRDHRADRCRRLVARHGGQGQRTESRRVPVPARGPDLVHLPPPRGLSRRRRGVASIKNNERRIRNSPTRQRGTPASGTDERSSRAARPSDGRTFPRTPQRRTRRLDGRRPGRQPGQGRRARRRQRRLELSRHRRRHGSRSHRARHEPRAAAIRRSDPQGPHLHTRVQPRLGRAHRHGGRPRDWRSPRRRRASPRRRQRTISSSK